jgi:hypothetical protein
MSSVKEKAKIFTSRAPDVKILDTPAQDAERWRHWRATALGLTWRVALPEDMSSIERMWKAKRRVLGTKCPLPDLFKSPVLIALVAENNRGQVVDGVFLEAVVDVTKLGAKPEGLASLAEISGDLAAFVKGRKFRCITAAMPRHVSARMAGGLVRAGFHEQRLALWDRWV